MSAISPKEREFLFLVADRLFEVGIIPQCRIGIPFDLVVFVQRTIGIFRIVFLRVGFDRLGICDDEVGGDNALFQQQFIAFIEQFLNFRIFVAIQKPIKVG